MSQMSHTKYNPVLNADQPTNPGEANELYHGDLRKGAYLKRRAEYQMQANAPVSAQAGTIPPHKTPHPGRRNG